MKNIFYCFKQLSSNFKRILELSIQFIPELRPLSSIAGGLILSFDKTLYFYARNLSLFVRPLKYLKTIWNTK